MKILLFMMLALALVGCDKVVEEHTVQIEATVIALHHTPSSGFVGVGFTSGGNVAITSGSTSAKYTATVELETGVRGFLRMRRSTFLERAVGDQILLTCRKTVRESGETDVRCPGFRR